MNRSAKGSSLTWLTIGLVVFIGVILLIYSPQWGIYTNLMNDNGKGVNSEYATAYDNLTSQQGTLTTFSDEFSAKSFTESILNLPNTFLSAINIGLTTISMLAQLPGYFISIINILGSTLHMPPPLIWIALTVLGIYVASMLIKAKRGTVSEP